MFDHIVIIIFLLQQGETSLVVLDCVESSQTNTNDKKLEVFSSVGSVKTFFLYPQGGISRFQQGSYDSTNLPV